MLRSDCWSHSNLIPPVHELDSVHTRAGFVSHTYMNVNHEQKRSELEKRSKLSIKVCNVNVALVWHSGFLKILVSQPVREDDICKYYLGRGTVNYTV